MAESVGITTTVVRSETPARYVWVEAYEITLYEESHTTGRITTKDWPDLDNLEEAIAEAKADPYRKVSHMMRKDEWEKRIDGGK